MIAGGFDRKYRVIPGQKISSLPHVSSTSPFVAMETIKEGSSGKMPVNGVFATILLYQ